MGAPAAALIPVDAAVKQAMQVLTGDLVTFQGQVFRRVEYKVGRKRQEFLTPIDYQVHINPLGVMLGLGAAGLAVLAGVIAWQGIEIPGAIKLFPGIRDTELGKSISGRLEERKREKETERQADLRTCLEGCASEFGLRRGICEAECRKRFG